MRLDKWIADRSEYSRSEVKQILKKGGVKVDGVPEKSPQFDVKEGMQVSVQGTLLSDTKHITLMLHKPVGCVTALRDEKEKTVMEYIPPAFYRKDLVPVGRLDKDTSGLLIFTTDGELCHKLTSPKHHVEKLYLADLDRPYEETYRSQFQKGMVLRDGTQCKPADIVCSKENPKQVLISLSEGQYHQVRRMIAAVGNHVVNLKRVQIGNMNLPFDLAEGDCLDITNKNINKLFESIVFDEVAFEILGKYSSK